MDIPKLIITLECGLYVVRLDRMEWITRSHSQAVEYANDIALKLGLYWYYDDSDVDLFIKRGYWSIKEDENDLPC